MSLTLIGYPISPFVRKVRVVLEQKGMTYVNDPVVPYTERDKVLAVNPAGTVPVLLGENAQPHITDSADIVAWAEGEVPFPSVFPSTPKARERALQIQHFADTQLAQVFGGMMFGQRMVVAYYFGKGRGREDMVEHAMRNLAPQLLDQIGAILGEEDYAAGSFSVGDIAMASWLRGAETVGFTLDAARWPKVAAWRDRVYAQPGFAKVIASESTHEPVLWAAKAYNVTLSTQATQETSL